MRFLCKNDLCISPAGISELYILNQEKRQYLQYYWSEKGCESGYSHLFMKGYIKLRLQTLLYILQYSNQMRIRISSTPKDQETVFFFQSIFFAKKSWGIQLYINLRIFQFLNIKQQKSYCKLLITFTLMYELTK